MTTLAFESETERDLALKDFMDATETLFAGRLTDKEYQLADGHYQRWRNHNRMGVFYFWTTSVTERSPITTGDHGAENAS